MQGIRELLLGLDRHRNGLGFGLARPLLNVEGSDQRWLAFRHLLKPVRVLRVSLQFERQGLLHLMGPSNLGVLMSSSMADLFDVNGRPYRSEVVLRPGVRRLPVRAEDEAKTWV